MKLIINKDRSVIPIGTWGTKNENDYEILDFEFPEELENYNKRIVYLLGENNNPWDVIDNNKAYITNGITSKEKIKGYVWCTKENSDRPADTDFRSEEFDIQFNPNENPTGIVPTPTQVDGFNAMLTQMNDAIDEMEEVEEVAEQAISNINQAIQETENLDIDVSDKVDGDVTVTLTKKDASTKTVVLSDGTSLMFNWNGTSLGIKTEDDAEYTYVDLQGVQGPVGPQGEAFQIKKTYSSVAEMNADFNNMEVGDYVMIASTVEVEDNAKLYTRGQTQWIFISDFSGAQGIKGETGATPNIQIGTVTSGAEPNVTRSGTNENPIFNFTLVPGEKGDKGDTGATGNGIASINKTSTVGYVDTYTITYTNGNTTTFNVTNGEVSQQMLDNTVAELQQEIDELSENMPWSETTQATEIQVTDAAKYSRNKLELFGNTEQASTTGIQLFKYPYYENTVTRDGITFTVNSDGSIHVQGTATAKTSFIVRNRDLALDITEGETYTLVASGLGVVDSTIWLDTFGQSGNFLDKWLLQENSFYASAVAQTKDITPLIKITVENGAAINTDVQILLYKGSYDSSKKFEKYTNGPSPNPDYPQDIHVVTGNNTINVGSTQYPLNLGSIELCKIGDYQDYIYKDNGNWYKYGAIGKVVLDGINNVFSSKTGNSGNVYVYELANAIPTTSNDTSVNVLAKYFKAVPYNNLASNDTCVASYQQTTFVRCKFGAKSNITTLELANNWLTTHNVPIYYPLNTPTSTQITNETLISQLDAIYEHLQLQKGINNITVTPGDLAPYMKLNYMQDLPSKLSTIESRLSALEE